MEQETPDMFARSKPFEYYSLCALEYSPYSGSCLWFRARVAFNLSSLRSIAEITFELFSILYILEFRSRPFGVFESGFFIAEACVWARSAAFGRQYTSVKKAILEGE